MAVGPLHLPVASTALGQNRRKHSIRAVFRSLSLVGLVTWYGVFNLYDVGSFTRQDPELRSGQIRGFGTSYPGSENNNVVPRRLTEQNLQSGIDNNDIAGALADWEAVGRTTAANERILNDGNVFDQDSRKIAEGGGTAAQSDTAQSCDDIKVAEPTWFLAWYIIGVLYMFLALAIVCDEFFVPALEEMSSERHLNLSMDVAGATLMAAGGSAPELFTSLIGTFNESSIGIGTIVGSAVFNVLFVIACCSLLSHEVLQLTWWPLFRDSSYYALGLIVLAIFVGVNTTGYIDIWEAIVLLVMYFGYVLLMYFNQKLYRLLTGKELDAEDDDQAAETRTAPETEENGGNGFADENRGANQEVAPRPTLGQDRDDSSRSLGSNRSGYGQFLSTHEHHHNADFRWPGTFRAGVLKLLRDPHSWLETAGVGIVSKMAGDVDHVFRTIDVNGDGEIDREELEKLFSHLDCHISREEMDAVFRELDPDGNGQISEQEFAAWYVRSEERIKSKVKEMFDHFDEDNSGTIDREEVRRLLEQVEPRVTEKDVDDALEAMYKEGSRDEISLEEFSDWYIHSLIYEQQKKQVDEEFEGVCENLKPPSGGSIFDYIKWLLVLPLVFTLVITIPDVSRPGWGKFCYLSFVVSIAWIGLYSFFMVNWTETIGNTIGIPSVVMGLTFLAAGTSVPDLLSSVIVARKGEGDMAVSSSIGSNIFDILVGLPLPWIIFSALRGKSIEIGADNIW
eukprot:CAMPEP_0113552436 /NCGR_PEP_ID=MMETSP0015_2-20120614/15066_1 /TAXON_ID=2838 /ORGANISM="Odontella" /LENGTH=734 /DNA_ID=CAMNT_0000453413 /DNA_START=209 /DNA_END=2410 /DNA_ORIENTATION=- /assembly_acc=CAM_ASM_000160